MILVDAPVSSDSGTLVAATLAVMTAIATFFAQRAARMAKQNRRAQQVPTIHDGVKDVGPAVAHLESQLNQVISGLGEVKEAQRYTSMKVENIENHQSRHEGQHEGLQRDVDRLLRRVYNGGDKPSN